MRLKTSIEKKELIICIFSLIKPKNSISKNVKPLLMISNKISYARNKYIIRLSKTRFFMRISHKE